ncbi:DUF72 domain-containing protein [Enterococcus sp.]|uniref:DUF72 domain-containing protein n=1 Tax=Enterococcus sp. TaxID=35783 RepID=UPI0028AAE4D0|nr:DUF72 domain-containing protein [Enterococcus sp.]
MIRIGCTTFSEHGSLVDRKSSKLFEYARYFPIVELDTTYHFLPKEKDVRNWLTQVPDNFRFVLKVHQSITTQGALPEGMTLEESLQRFKEAIAPMVDAGKLFCLLAQFPNQFKCTKQHVAYLGQVRNWFPEYPLAIELRDQSWYQPAVYSSMIDFMKERQLSLVVVDQPKRLSTTIPLDTTVTNPAFALCRLHGRNDSGWTATGPEAKNLRTLYRYNEKEINQLSTAVRALSANAQEIAVIFNNNAGRDAADNAREMISQLQLTYEALNPNQLALF